MSSATSELCQSLQMIDRKTEYVIEAHIPCANCQSMQLVLADGKLSLSVQPKESQDFVPIHSWEIEEGVHIENMTAEYKSETLFIRLPKADVKHGRPLQYTETIDITPVACGG
ncbi:MAG: Hsp20/alpha crystallin family protein [Planctomycetia bacterium]|nr:Hsp20/alpha crystallin family protein [Planctomycetia bacterium]